MKPILKKILNVAKDIAEETASETIPGAGIVIGGVTALFDKNNDNNAQAINDIENGVLQAVSSLAPDKIANASQLAKGLTDLKAAFDEIKTALKK